jgi:hypothetical protein
MAREKGKGQRVHRLGVPFNPGTPFLLSMPAGGGVVHFDWQQAKAGDYPEWSVWFLVPEGYGTGENEMLREFIILPTGGETPEGVWLHLGTAKASGNFFMWHLFVKVPQ